MPNIQHLHQHFILRQLDTLLTRKVPVKTVQSFFSRAPSPYYRTPALSADSLVRKHVNLSHHPQLSWKLPRQPRRYQTNQRNAGARPRPDLTSQLGSPPPQPSLTLSERFRKLSREYGWTALGVYVALSALDFPICFLAVRTLGTQRIAEWEQVIIRGFWTVASLPFPGGEEQVRAVFQSAGDGIKSVLVAAGLSQESNNECEKQGRGLVLSKAPGEFPDGAITEQEWSWGVDEAQAAHQDHACKSILSHVTSSDIKTYRVPPVTDPYLKHWLPSSRSHMRSTNRSSSCESHLLQPFYLT